MSTTPLSVRVNRLFALAHEDGAPGPTTAEVAESLSQVVGRQVSAESVQALRDGVDPYGEPEILSALAACFHVPVQYLSDSDYHDYDTLIRFKLAVREAGVNHMSMRGGPSEQQLSVEAMERMIPLLQNLPNQFGTDSR
ncbi:hypothetical protein [Rhodococcus sp. NPDC058521]|uniref:hypothetical protein n=1 Tax=Rhodococcus sp. NPDC058521 TaxID=3346536 RepID=UPI00364818EA